MVGKSGSYLGTAAGIVPGVAIGKTGGDGARNAANSLVIDLARAAMHWSQEGKDPDYRFTLANERTFLAWIRTALAILAGALVIHQVATRFEPRWMLVAATSALAVLAGLMSVGAYRQWKANEIAMRHSRSLPLSRLIPMLAAAVSLLAVIGVVLMPMTK